MDISLVIKHRLEELGLDQRDLAGAAQVTESYISQLLTRNPRPLQEKPKRIFHNSTQPVGRVQVRAVDASRRMRVERSET